MSVCVLGSLNLDVICQVAELPLPGETVVGRSVERSPGGKGANQAIAAARHGAETFLIGAVGLDEAGAFLLANLRQAGVDVEEVTQVTGPPTGQAYITVSSSGENAIVVIGGANRALTTAQLRVGALERASVFVSQFEIGMEVIEAAFSCAAARRGITILNAAPALADGASLFTLADLLVLNQVELDRYAGAGSKRPKGTHPFETTIDAARRLISRADQRVIVTLGAGGAMAVSSDGVILVDGQSARVVDTTGAGDCFCGVLAASLNEGCSLRDAMASANAAAALSTERRGAGPAAPMRAETLARLAIGA